MKKFLIISMAFMVASFGFAMNVSAAGLGSQSIEVTVGEVDEVDIDNGEQGADAPETGIFGLGADDGVVVTLSLVSVAVALAILLKHIYCKSIKSH